MPGRRWSEGLHQAVEAKEGVPIQAENQTLASITFQNYFRLYDKLAGMTGTADTEAFEFQRDLRPRGGGDPDQPADRAQGLQRPGLPDRRRKVQRHPRRHPRLPRARPAGAGGHHLDRELRAAVGPAEKSQAAAQGAERQVPREGSRDHRPGRRAGLGHHRHQHGRPRYRHPAGRQRRQAGRPDPRRRIAVRSRKDRAHREGPRRLAAAPRAGHGGGRPAHHRHRAPRIPPYRQPAARPCRSPGRPGFVPLLPVAGRPPDAHLRLRPRARHHGRRAGSCPRARRSSTAW